MVARFKKTVAFGFSKVWGHFGAFFSLTISFFALFVFVVLVWSGATLIWEANLLTDLRDLFKSLMAVTGNVKVTLNTVRIFASETFRSGREVYIFLLGLFFLGIYLIGQVWTYLLIKLHLDVYHKDKGISEISVKGKWPHFLRFLWAKTVYNLAIIALIAVDIAGGYFIIQWPWGMVESSIIRFLLLTVGLCWIVGMIFFFVLARMRLRYFSYIILDTNMGLLESMSTSVRITEGNFWYVFGYAIFYSVLYAIGHWFLTLFFFTPAAIGSDVYAYHALKDQKKKK